MDRSALYRSLKKGNPEWKTVEKILDYLGYDLKLVKLPAGRAGPFDRALGPEHFEGLPGNDLLFHIVPLPACR